MNRYQSTIKVRKMKRLVLQVNVKLDNHNGFKRFEPIQDVYNLSETRAKFYAEQCNADYYQITDCNYLPEKHPVYQRFKMYDMNYDQILYLDMDAIILPSCPNVFELFSEHDFSAVRDYPWDSIQKSTGKSYDEKRKVYNKVYEANDSYRPFCSGAMLIKKEFLNKTKDSWRKYLNTFDKASNGIQGGHDQAIFNKLVVEHYNGKYNELDEQWGAWYRNGKYIEHIGGPFKHKFDINKFCKKHNFTKENPYSNIEKNNLFEF